VEVVRIEPTGQSFVDQSAHSPRDGRADPVAQTEEGRVPLGEATA
jgi:hypothetical protein